MRKWFAGMMTWPSSRSSPFATTCSWKAFSATSYTSARPAAATSSNCFAMGSVESLNAPGSASNSMSYSDVAVLSSLSPDLPRISSITPGVASECALIGGGGGSAFRTARIIARELSMFAIFSQCVKIARPPGLRTRAVSTKAASLSSKCMYPWQHVTTSKVASPYGSLTASAISHLTFGRLLARSTALAIICGEMSVTVTLVFGSRVATSIPGSPGPAARSRTLPEPEGSALTTASTIIGQGPPGLPCCLKM
mmetsp:Transcript_13476/g.35086  ORF Transcript_13476/g.35086 Transcript_13476/m.35086 type:complete len:253 (+) Transcript_13476:346-1104(+)